jgi:hypothetical protein
VGGSETTLKAPIIKAEDQRQETTPAKKRAPMTVIVSDSEGEGITEDGPSKMSLKFEQPQEQKGRANLKTGVQAVGKGGGGGWKREARTCGSEVSEIEEEVTLEAKIEDTRTTKIASSVKAGKGATTATLPPRQPSKVHCFSRVTLAARAHFDGMPWLRPAFSCFLGVSFPCIQALAREPDPPSRQVGSSAALPCAGARISSVRVVVGECLVSTPSVFLVCMGHSTPALCTPALSSLTRGRSF